MHPADETTKSKIMHVYIPAALSAMAAFVSLFADTFYSNETFWFQRSGAILAAVGGYIAFHESKQFFKVIEDEKGEISTYFNSEIPYKWLALFYAVVGTAIWGYGDLPFKVA